MDLIKPLKLTEDRPLVTLAVFAYNQERYIRATIDAAFAQRYGPLEIILSDDCSSDHTFDIMKEMAALYDGPHSVRLHRTCENLGLVNHVITVARLALGKYLIMNAGDDISYPERTEVIVATFDNSRADCINSAYDEINEDGKILTLGNTFKPSPSTQRVFAQSEIAKRQDKVVQSAIGFAASYRTKFWAELPLSQEKLNIEDGLATLLLNCQGATLLSHREPLIGYRLHNRSLSLRQAEDTRRESILLREMKISDGGRQIIHTIEYVVNYFESMNIAIESAVLRELKRSSHYGLIVSDFWGDNFYGRLRRLLRSRRKPEFLFVIPRLFGQEIFLRLKVGVMVVSSFKR